MEWNWHVNWWVLKLVDGIEGSACGSLYFWDLPQNKVVTKELNKGVLDTSKYQKGWTRTIVEVVATWGWIHELGYTGAAAILSRLWLEVSGWSICKNNNSRREGQRTGL